ncbi:MAG: RDD family protein [Synechococcales cyanobacterium C42_A2020_086]|jgi:uncharacterized RDD family membrane protein YckC|nr:RDD family protein [Synechococcales cyanobacterium M58_A2018_015]MBF2076306.1 RDD family protein [Synechococcales cyanobacterium C42_A2020_086]
MSSDLPPVRYPKVPLGRRSAAFCIDLFTVGLVSASIGPTPIALGLVFIPAWLGMRVVLVSKNHGQSLGWWAMDMRIADQLDGRIPELKTLLKREGLLGGAAFLAWLGLLSLSPATPWAPLCFVPLAIDCSAAFADSRQQAFHDQWAETVLVPSRRGFSLDLKIRQLLADVQNRMK